MAAWELALIIMAVTYMMVNMASLIVTMVLLINVKGVFTKSAKIMNKMIDYSEKSIDEFFNEDL